MNNMQDLKYLIKSISNWHKQGEKKNILINATPRGGSTWLMELIASQPGMKYYDEPFNIRRDNVQRIGLFKDWSDFLPEGCDKDRVFNFLNDLVHNRYRFMNPPPFRKNHHIITSRIVYKLHELEFLIDEIAQACNCQVVYLIRHPIPNSLSRNQIPRLDYFVKSDYYREKHLDDSQFENVKKIFQSGSKLQKYTLCWCYENIDALKASDLSKWLVISYEELVLNSAKSCKLLYDRLDLDDYGILLKTVGEPAANIALSRQETHEIMHAPDDLERKRKLITRWKSNIDDSDERAVFDVLSLFGIEDYSYGRFIPAQRLLNFNDTEGLLDNRTA
jgi:hypothetical protein